MLKFTLKFIYMRGAATCFDFSQPSSGMDKYAATRPNWFCKRRILTDY